MAGITLILADPTTIHITALLHVEHTQLPQWHEVTFSHGLSTHC